ncbi:MAG: 3-deoxy-manno-octulosonate cytidylyltransferase [Elusimicrobia bacterium]|nr:3-deoxy-manno-octulosonate cytidylyltransferase [Elusimicrobiota bacterium]
MRLKSKQKTVIVIPVRWGSERFPGKPLAMISGKSMLHRVWAIAQSCRPTDDVWIATDDERIKEHAQKIGAQAMMTPASCRNGTERVLEATRKIGAVDIVINLQGDAPLTPPWILDALIEKMTRDAVCQLSTPAIRLNAALAAKIRSSLTKGKAGATTVTFDQKGRALYFSKALIPNLRNPNDPRPPIFKHLGLYAYRLKTLETLAALPPGVFEEAEQLEQLRALEYGIPIDVIVVDAGGRTLWSVDNPADISMVEQIIKSEGELI